MPASDFLDPRQIHLDLDRPFVGDLPEPKPLVFVLGLHRSGTTFLYQLLADAFPVAVSTVYHVTHYKRLLHAEREGLVTAQHADLRAHLANEGIFDRGIDRFPVGPDGLEEHAFVLRKHSPRWNYGRESAHLFDEMLRKLSHLQPEAQALLLKNPHDLLVPDQILARYPHAKVILIRRDPVRVLNSQFRNSFLYREKPEPYLQLLLAGIPLWRVGFELMAAADRWVPDAAYQRLLIAGLRRSIADQLRRHYQAFARLPQDRFVEVSYEDLVANPAAVIDSLGGFLGLPHRPEAHLMASAPRNEPLQDAVAAVADAFRAQLAAFPDAALVAG